MSRTEHPLPHIPTTLRSSLAQAGIPLADCTECSDLSQDDDLDPDAELDYPKGFDVDLDSEMIGSVKNYGRQIIISTGKSDWPREVSEDTTQLAGLIKLASEEAAGTASGGRLGAALFGKLAKKLKSPEGNPRELPGIYPSSLELPPTADSKLSILNSSFISSSSTAGLETVIVLPDFKVVENVEESHEGAKELFESYLRPGIGRAGAPSSLKQKSWPLPYRALVLLCSHKKRDKRCHIAAPLLIAQFHHHLERHNLGGDERGDDITHGPAIEEWDALTRESQLEQALREPRVNGRVGLFKISHIGGHKFAGNVIIYFPNGSCIWYGRVRPRDVAAVVEKTIVQGQVIPEFLRGGMGISNKNGTPKGILAW